jgi:predicted transcriptional regulator
VVEKHAYHNLKIMEQIEQSPRLTNRMAAQKLGISVKLAHEILGKLAKKGWLHIRKHHARRWDYFLTPKGIAEKVRLTYQFLDFSMEFYREARRHSAQAMKDMHDAGGQTVAFLGATELAEIASLGAREWGQEIIAIHDDDHAGEAFLGLDVRPLAELRGTEADHILITAFDPAAPMLHNYMPDGAEASARLMWIFADAALEPSEERLS